jgi:phospholipid/cholesterol/gamma-HCH transport system substrate-binding protein
MEQKQGEAGLHPAIWTAILVAGVVAILVLTAGMFNRDFRTYAKVTVTADRAGLVMEPGAKVKFRGVQVGRVASIQSANPVRLHLELYPEQLKFVPANVGAQIAAPTAFGNKYVELLIPTDPSPKRLADGAVVNLGKVSIEANTVFQNLVQLLDKIDPAKLNAILSAFAEGFRGKGDDIGRAITDFNQVLLAVNPRADTVRADYRALKGFADAYSAAAPDIVSLVDAATTTSATITRNSKALDSVLLSTIGLSDSGINLIGPNKENLIHSINVLEPTTRLLKKYNPELTCMLVGGKKLLDEDYGWGDVIAGRNGYSALVDAALMLGDDPYRYPENLPINDIKGGPGGAPSCGSLPDVSKNWPKRYLVTNSGWGRGMDLRPNPGIGFPGLETFFPWTRGAPEPPTLRYPGGPAPGPSTYPGGPPTGAQLYAPDGTPLYPGLPPAPPPGRAPEPAPPAAGSEPFVPAYPGLQPTPLPGPPPAP